MCKRVSQVQHNRASRRSRLDEDEAQIVEDHQSAQGTSSTTASVTPSCMGRCDKIMHDSKRPHVQRHKNNFENHFEKHFNVEDHF